MKQATLLRAALLALAGTAILVACGGGSGGGSASGSAATTNTTASTASGVLSAFGSVIVNGREYATGSSTSVVDGDADDAASSVTALQVGMTVDVNSDSAGNATFIRYTSAVRGEVDAIDSANSKITVLGQTVLVTSATNFAGSRTASGTTTSVTTLSDVAVGDYVVVYGYLQCTSSGTPCTADDVVASLVVEPASAGAYRAEGYIQNLDSTGTSFTINGLTVAVTASGSAATSCSPSPCALANGQFVAVRAASAPSTSGSTLTLDATRIVTLTQAPVLTAGSTVSLAGPVASLDTSADTFVVRGIAVNATSLASTVATLADGDLVEVTGTVNTDGSISASAITVERHASLAVTAPLDSDSASASTLTLLGQTFTVNSSTHFLDLAQGVRPFNAGNFASVLAAGDQLLVSGYTSAGTLIATRVVRIPTPASPTVGVQGIASADSSSADTVSVGGVTIDVSAGTTLSYGGAGSAATLAGFFAAITPGTTVVTALGTAGSAPGTITASEAAALSNNCLWVTGLH